MKARAAMVVLSIVLAACANTAPPAPGAGAAAPAAPATSRDIDQVRVPPTGGHHPPQRLDLRCKVDADCTAKPHCRDVPCRCVREQCIAAPPAIDPVIDPVPVPPPET